MSSARRDPSDETRERIIRQAPRPRLSLSSLSRNDRCHSLLANPHGLSDEVKVRNRFQHSQNNLLCYSNSVHSSQHTNMLQTLNSTKDRNDGNHPNSEDEYTTTAIPINYSAISEERSPRFDNVCSRCRANTLVYEHNVKKCHNCGLFSLIKSSHTGTPLQAREMVTRRASGTPRLLVRGNHREESPWKNTNEIQEQLRPSPKPRSTKSKPRSKICLTISSDEGEDGKDEDDNSLREASPKASTEREEKSNSPDSTSAESDTHQSYRIPKLSDRMKLQGGKNNENQPIDDSPGLAIVRPSYLLTTTEQGFELGVKHVQLGSLAGKGTTPLTLCNNVLRIEVECSFDIVADNKKKKVNERYMLALSSVEVSKIIVNYETELLVVSVVPSKRYSDIVNEALSKSVIDAGSNSYMKQQILFIIDSSKDIFKRTLERTLPHLQRISPVSSQMSDGINCVLSNFQSQGEDRSHYATQSSTSTAEKAQSPKVSKTIFVYPSPPKKGGIALTNVDVDCLLPGVYLNDIIIDFYLRYLYEEILTEEQRAKTYIFNSYFYTRLSKRAFGDSRRSESPIERMHSQVKKWTRDIDIFERDYIIIPVNEHSHWFLVIICFASKTEVDDSVDSNGSSESTSSDGIEEVRAEPTNSEGGKEGERMKVIGNEVKSGMTGVKSKHEDYNIPMDVDHDNLDANADQGLEKVLQKEKSKIVKKIEYEEEQSKAKNSTCKKSFKTDKSPVSENKAHSAVYQQPCILLFDSLISGGRSRVFSNLRHYLSLEWREKRRGLGPEKVFTKNNLKGSFPKIPLQNNDCDCGVYVLQFAESFFQHPILNFKFPIRKENWFTKTHVDAKRDKIREIIANLQQQFSAGK